MSVHLLQLDTRENHEEAGKWLSNSLVQVLFGDGGGFASTSSSSLSSSFSTFFCKNNTLGSGKTFPVPIAHISSPMSEAWEEFFCCSLFVYINSLLELQPSPSLPTEVMGLSPKRRE